MNIQNSNFQICFQRVDNRLSYVTHVDSAGRKSIKLTWYEENPVRVCNSLRVLYCIWTSRGVEREHDN